MVKNDLNNPNFSVKFTQKNSKKNKRQLYKYYAITVIQSD